jgi:hypothetical protein
MICTVERASDGSQLATMIAFPGEYAACNVSVRLTCCRLDAGSTGLGEPAADGDGYLQPIAMSDSLGGRDWPSSHCDGPGPGGGMVRPPTKW